MNSNRIILYGSIIGGLQALLLVLASLSDNSTLTAVSNLGWVIHIVVLVMALQEAGKLGLKYGRQVGVGNLISLVAGLILAVSYLIITNYLVPDFTDKTIQSTIVIYRQSGLTEAQINDIRPTLQSIFSPVSLAFISLTGTLISGLIYSLIIAIFTRAKQDLEPA